MVTLDKGDGTHYSIGVKTANIFSTTIELMGKIEAFDAIKFPGGCASTSRMLIGESSGLRLFTVDFEKKCLSENF